MKILMLLMINFVWLHNAIAQSKAGLEQYCYMDNTSVTINPKAWYQSNKGWYVEGRYNYEAIKTLSLLAGKTFEYKSNISYSITPMAGVVSGKFNGVALATNTSVEYKKISFAMQSQYTFSTDDKACSFMYNWADISYGVFRFLSAGMSLQQTNLYRKRGASELGFFLNWTFRKWELPVYIFNPAGNQKYMVLGLNVALQ